MLDLPSTIAMMRALSLSANADELAQVFARYLRDTTSVNRGLVIQRRDLTPSHYRVELCADWDAQRGRFTESHPDTIRQGGLLATLLEAGELRIISDLSITSPEPARDLLDGHKALMAFPIFEKGHATGATYKKREVKTPSPRTPRFVSFDSSGRLSTPDARAAFRPALTPRYLRTFTFLAV